MPEVAHLQKIQITPRRAARVRKGAGMTEGLIWLECYLPFDTVAFNQYVQKFAELGSAEAVRKFDSDLADRALTPIDTQGEAMLPADVLQLAHSFLVQSRKIDVMHDEQARSTVQVVQSFVNTAEIASPHFWPGSWVAVLKLDPGSAEWAAVDDGDLSAVSFQALVNKLPITARLPEGSTT